ncbi:MAG: type II toxin-antitoxin system VapC family toxin [Cyanobacteria bacterium]|nr:type II toxin-antitoxin system VapC family toxin [Cyanobacteriota bacterium]
MSEKNNFYFPDKINPGYVLDSYALLAFFNNEKGSDIVRNLLLKARDGNHSLYLLNINLGEIIYIVEREFGVNGPQLALSKIGEMPVKIIYADLEMTLKAAHLKANYPISYADAFAAACAIIKSARLVTGDNDFSKLDYLVDILWL